MTKNITSAAVAGVLLSILTSCKKLVQINPPQTQLVTASVFNNNAAATAAQTAIYTKMVTNSESYNMSQYNGLLADELMNYSSSAFNLSLYQNAMTGLTSNSVGLWTHGYNYIYQANAIIGALQNNSAVSPAVAQQLTGESKFLRAFWHFYLANAYGDVPVVTSTDYTINNIISRTPQAQVYQQVIVNLKDAALLLNSGYVDGSDTSVYPIASAERVRPTKAAAAALLARAYLYTKKYDSAAAQATLVINNSMFSLISPLTATVFNKNSKEAIWQLSTPLPTSNGATADGQGYILTSKPSNFGISTQLLSSFEPNDNRKNIWIGSYTTTTAPVTTYYFPHKYRSTSATNGASVTEYVMVLRLAEQYLIRAEAEAHLGDSTDAVIDLNIIRSRAGLPVYSASIQGPLLTAILHERQVELFVEWGHRWFDLNRTGNTNAVMSVVTPLKGGLWNSDGHQQLYPIPIAQILIDGNLTQNPGY